MNKNDILLSLTAIAILGAGIGIGGTIRCCEDKTAVVDVAAAVGKSSEVQALKIDVAAKKQELTQWLQKVQSEVKSEKNKGKKEALLKQYDAEFAQKREVIAKEYNEKLQAIDKSINDIIVKTARQNGYKIVIPKSVVLYGGKDITEEVLKAVK